MKRMRLIRIFSTVLSLCLVIGIVAIKREPVLADSDASTGLTYTIVNGSATVTGFTAPVGFGGALAIPGTIGGASVTSISEYAMNYSSAITSVTIPSSVTSIGDGAFSDCPNLTSITVDASNTIYKSIGNILYSKDGTQLICCPGGMSGSVIIPSSVTAIGNSAFYDCSKLTGISIPSDVTTIGAWAFGYCINLTSITIPSKVTSIGDYAFYWLNSMESITIPGSVMNIGYSAFAGGSTLQTIIVDASSTVYKSIEGLLYTKDGTQLICCPGGKSGILTIPNSVTSIADRGFSDCGQLTDIIIPNSVMSIGDGAFNYCINLDTITVDSNNTNYKSIDGILFSKDGTQLIRCPQQMSGNITIPSSVINIDDDAFSNCYLTDVIIPASVISIGYDAFWNCPYLTSIAIPNSVTSIGDFAFGYCYDLKDAYFYGNAPTLGTAVFEGCADGFTVHYLNTSTGYTNPWNGYKAIPFTTEGGVSYETHVQDIGWQGYVSNGATAGTSGQSKRLEAIRIRFDGANGGIEYRTHIQDFGWQDWVQNDDLSGTSGLSKRLEAIQIRLTGDVSGLYDVYYRVHAQNVGWMDWAKNGESAGTAGYSYRLEAIEIVMVKKGDAAPGSTATPFIGPSVSEPVGAAVSYKTHIQDIGWQSYVSNGATSGTSGQSKRMEAIRIKLENVDGDIVYRTHVQDYGWMDWMANDELSGTSGESKRLEAIEIWLSGAAADTYDVYYRVHAQNFGWMGWAKNGESAGTAGYSYRLEAIEVVLVPKGGAAPGSTDGAFRQA